MATLNPHLRQFWRTRARNKVLYGGRDSSKTWDAAGMAIFLASKYSLKFLCTRQFQNRITDSVYSTLKVQIERFGLKEEFDITNNSIIHKVTGSEFIFYGLWRNIDEIKSLESVDICWIEEAHNLTKDQWEILEPTIRKEGSEFWIIFNPKLITDFVYQRFVLNPPKDTLVRKINYNENLFLSDTSKRVIQAKKEEDIEAYKHTYLGEPLANDDLVLIKRSWVLAAINAHEKLGIDPGTTCNIGFDVADDGNDANCNVMRKGILTTFLEEWFAGEDELLKSAKRTYILAEENNAHINYDAIGVGASMGAKFKELNGPKRKTTISYSKFKAGESVLNPNDMYKDTQVTNKEFFSNIKAQAWWEIADKFKTTFNAVTKGYDYDESEIISISDDLDGLEELINELTTPRKDYDNYDRVKVESKKDLAKRGFKSPNKADAFIMAYFKSVEVNPLLAAMKK